MDCLTPDCARIGSSALWDRPACDGCRLACARGKLYKGALRFAVNGDTRFLQKPATPSAILACVREVLDGP